MEDWLFTMAFSFVLRSRRPPGPTLTVTLLPYTTLFRAMDTPVIEVRLWDQRVGAVAPDPRAGCHAFEYDPAWRRRGIELAPLTMPTDASEPVFLFPDLARPSFHGLPGLLADAPPDAFRSEVPTSELQATQTRPNE